MPTSKAKTKAAAVPHVGQVVSILTPGLPNNGAEVAPAIVTRVWDKANDDAPQLINVRVLLDSSEVPWLTSVPFLEARPEEKSEDDEAEELNRVGYVSPRVCFPLEEK